jgi:uncharacterized membrane protein (UPF0127 family)
VRGKSNPHRLFAVRAAGRPAGTNPADSAHADRRELRFVGADGGCGRIRVIRARGFVARLRGLIGRPAPKPGEGFWIEPCAAVHTFGVREALDLVFVSACMVVQRVEASVLPRRVRIGPGARAVLELRAGEARRIGLRVGLRLDWERAPRANEYRHRPSTGGIR